MTIEEAIEHLITIKEYYTSDRDFTTWGEDYEPLSSEEKQAVDKAVETFEKQMPKKPNRGVCPSCGSRHIYAATLTKAECFKFCGNCGQALDWSDNEPTKPKGKRMFTDEQIDRILWEIEQINKEQREKEND